MARMQVVTVAGGNLYRLALQYLGDATQWNRIAQQNNLRDPQLSGVRRLVIPAQDASASGGIFVPATS